jgi:very-short-patch-repair endonuclease
MPVLAGHFRSNARLLAPLEDYGEMEVDFLCEARRLVMELDRSQQLDDAVMHRRARRKDLLLQSHGCLVLRFLTEDIGKDRRGVLAAILNLVTRFERERGAEAADLR